MSKLRYLHLLGVNAFEKSLGRLLAQKAISSICNILEEFQPLSQNWNPRLALVYKMHSVDLPS